MEKALVPYLELKLMTPGDHTTYHLYLDYEFNNGRIKNAPQSLI
jgi:hypothetical protein